MFNHIGDGALPRSDPNLSGPEKGKHKSYFFSDNTVRALLPSSYGEEWEKKMCQVLRIIVLTLSTQRNQQSPRLILLGDP